MTGRLKRHYVAVKNGCDGHAVFELTPRPGYYPLYRLWQDDLSAARAVEIAAAMNALETQRSKDRRAEARRRRES